MRLNVIDVVQQKKPRKQLQVSACHCLRGFIVLFAISDGKPGAFLVYRNTFGILL